MNCLEYRRRKLADPRRLSREARSHASACPACSAFERALDCAELDLERSLDVPVPKGLAERALLGSKSSERPWRGLAFAASVLVALAGGFVMGVATQPDDDLFARLAIEHVAMEPEALASVGPAEVRTLRTVVRDLGGTLRQLPGKMVYFECCPAADGLVWHAVFETPQGHATLILVSGKRLLRPQTSATGRWDALAEPVHGGYYAIVTDSQAATAAFERALRVSVVWEI